MQLMTMVRSLWNSDDLTFELVLFWDLAKRMSSGPSEEEIQSKWPLHWMVWKDNHTALKRLLREDEAQVSSMASSYFTVRYKYCQDLERLDPRGRTPLHLAVSLSRVACATELLKSKADPLAENRHKWSGT